MELTPLTTQHEDDLSGVVADAKIMRHIGRGGVWSAAKLHNPLRESESEWKDGSRGTRGYYWAIVVDNRTAGFVGFHRARVGVPYAMRIVVGPDYQGRGVGAAALLEALARFEIAEPGVRITGAAHADNRGGAAIMLKVGFRETGPGRIGNTPVRRFVWGGVTGGNGGPPDRSSFERVETYYNIGLALPENAALTPPIAQVPDEGLLLLFPPEKLVRLTAGLTLQVETC